MSKKTLLIVLGVVVVVGAGIAWWLLSKPKLPPGFAGGNGRLEMQQYDVSTKWPGRLTKVLVDEGDTVDAGQVVATVDTEPLEAQLRSQEAKVREAEDNLRTAQAQIQAKQAEFAYNDAEYKRSQGLVARGAVSVQERDLDRAKADASRADLLAARAQASRAQFAIESATAETERLKAEIADYTLRAPLRARVETRNAQPGEVLGPGGKVLTLDDLADVSLLYFCRKVVGVGLFAKAERSKYTGNYQDCEYPNPTALDQSQIAPRNSLARNCRRTRRQRLFSLLS